MDFINLALPLSKESVSKLKAGDCVQLSGEIFTARDAAHKRITEAMQSGAQPPIKIEGGTIYYVGPCIKDGNVLSAGPTTSTRMDKYAPYLYDNGLIATIGKGDRTQIVYDSITKNKAAYFAAIGGAGAIYANAIEGSELVAYPDLGAEAIYRFRVCNFPVIVAIDSNGNSIYNK